MKSARTSLRCHEAGAENLFLIFLVSCAVTLLVHLHAGKLLCFRARLLDSMLRGVSLARTSHSRPCGWGAGGFTQPHLALDAGRVESSTWIPLTTPVLQALVRRPPTTDRRPRISAGTGPGSGRTRVGMASTKCCVLRTIFGAASAKFGVVANSSEPLGPELHRPRLCGLCVGKHRLGFCARCCSRYIRRLRQRRPPGDSAS